MPKLDTNRGRPFRNPDIPMIPRNSAMSMLQMCIVGNPNLYADQAQAVVDCLHRDSLVPKDYTVSRFNKEFSGTDGNTSFDMQNLQVRSCLVSNGYNVGYATDDTEQLW